MYLSKQLTPPFYKLRVTAMRSLFIAVVCCLSSVVYTAHAQTFATFDVLGAAFQTEDSVFEYDFGVTGINFLKVAPILIFVQGADEYQQRNVRLTFSGSSGSGKLVFNFNPESNLCVVLYYKRPQISQLFDINVPLGSNLLNLQ